MWLILTGSEIVFIARSYLHFRVIVKVFFVHSLIEYEWFFLNSYILPSTQTGTSNPGQSKLENNGNEEVLGTSRNSRTEASPSDEVKCHTLDTTHPVRTLVFFHTKFQLVPK